MCCPRAWPSRVSSTQRRKPSAGVNRAPSAPVTARSCNPDATAAMYSRQFSISDDDLPDGQGFDLVLLPEWIVQRLDHVPGTGALGRSGVDVRSSPYRSLTVRPTSLRFFRRNALLSPFFRSIRSIGTSRNVLVRRRLLTRTSA